jgi:hypothetical protein
MCVFECVYVYECVMVCTHVGLGCGRLLWSAVDVIIDVLILVAYPDLTGHQLLDMGVSFYKTQPGDTGIFRLAFVFT